MIISIVCITVTILLIIWNTIELIRDRKENEMISVVFCTLIIKGKKTLDQVPPRLRDEVKELLEALEVGV